MHASRRRRCCQKRYIAVSLCLLSAGVPPTISAPLITFPISRRLCHHDCPHQTLLLVWKTLLLSRITIPPSFYDDDDDDRNTKEKDVTMKTTTTNLNKDYHSMNFSISQNDLTRAEILFQADQVLASARHLRQSMTAKSSSLLYSSSSDLNNNNNNNNNNSVSFGPIHQKILYVADRVEQARIELASKPDPKIWTKIGSRCRSHHHGHHGRSSSRRRSNSRRDHHHDIIIAHYKLDDKRRLSARIEFLIDRSLLVPLLSVLVESELYNTWVPRWRFPPVGIMDVRKLAEGPGRTNQCLQADMDIPWKRDVIISSTGIDDVEANGLLGLHLGPLRVGEEIGNTGIKVPPPLPGVVRTLFEGTFLFHKCPNNHPVFEHITETTTNSSGDDDDDSDEEMILVGLMLFVDAKLSKLFPQWIANFIIRIAMIRLFQIFRNIAEDVHAGKRPDHSAAIARKRGYIYDWLDERVTTLLKRGEEEIVC